MESEKIYLQKFTDTELFTDVITRTKKQMDSIPIFDFVHSKPYFDYIFNTIMSQKTPYHLGSENTRKIIATGFKSKSELPLHAIEYLNPTYIKFHVTPAEDFPDDTTTTTGAEACVSHIEYKLYKNNDQRIGKLWPNCSIPGHGSQIIGAFYYPEFFTLGNIPINTTVKIDNFTYGAVLFLDGHLSNNFELIITKHDQHPRVVDIIFANTNY